VIVENTIESDEDWERQSWDERLQDTFSSCPLSLQSAFLWQLPAVRAQLNCPS